jgi:hypothetical protein
MNIELVEATPDLLSAIELSDIPVGTCFTIIDSRVTLDEIFVKTDERRGEFENVTYSCVSLPNAEISWLSRDILVRPVQKLTLHVTY